VEFRTLEKMLLFFAGDPEVVRLDVQKRWVVDGSFLKSLKPEKAIAYPVPGLKQSLSRFRSSFCLTSQLLVIHPSHVSIPVR